MKTLILNFLREEHGQDMVEYALVVGIIALGCVASMSTIASNVTAMWTKVGTAITTATGKIT